MESYLCRITIKRKMKRKEALKMGFYGLYMKDISRKNEGRRDFDFYNIKLSGIWFHVFFKELYRIQLYELDLSSSEEAPVWWIY